jgi:hypothetical protein
MSVADAANTMVSAENKKRILERVVAQVKGASEKCPDMQSGWI